MDRDEFRRDKARHIHHVQPVGLGQVDGLAGDLVELGQIGVGHIDQDIGGQIVVADFHHLGRQLKAPALRVLAYIAELFKGVHHALGRAFADVRRYRDIGQGHGAPRSSEAAKYGQALFQ